MTATAPPALPDTDLTLPAGEELTVVTDDGAALAVTVTGPDPAPGGAVRPPVVLSHGWTGTRAVWAPVARRLAAAGHRVVLYDQRGHGASGRGRAPFTVERLGDDLAAVAAAVDARGAVLAGHSMGGMSVMACACGHPDVLAERVRGLVLVATAAHGLGGRFERATDAALRGDRATRLLARRRVGLALVRPTFGRLAEPAHVEAARGLFVATHAGVRADAGRAMRAMDLRAGLEAVDLPALVVLGRRDRLIRNRLTREIVTRLPRAALVELAGAGHMLPLERPAHVAGAVGDLAGGGGLSSPPGGSLI